MCKQRMNLNLSQWLIEKTKLVQVHLITSVDWPDLSNKHIATFWSADSSPVDFWPTIFFIKQDDYEHMCGPPSVPNCCLIQNNIIKCQLLFIQSKIYELKLDQREFFCRESTESTCTYILTLSSLWPILCKTDDSMHSATNHRDID